jgi:uncharacterized RDD family membrane protein YckC
MSESHVVNPIPVEARPFQGRRAGVVSRTVAATLDFIVILAIVVATYVVWAATLFLWKPVKFSFPSPPFLVYLAYYGLLLFGYLTIAWATTGRTVGANIMGLRVLNARGQRLRVTGAALRSALCTLFPLGLFWCAVSRSNRSVQDMVLRTSVIYDWRPASRGSRSFAFGRDK